MTENVVQNIASGAPTTCEIVVAILEYLSAHTDTEHGASASEIADAIGVTAKTVRAHLNTLRQTGAFCRTVGKLTRSGLQDDGVMDGRPGWYLEPILDVAQMRLLADAAVMAHADAQTRAELQDIIYRCAGRARPSADMPEIHSPRHYNTEFMVTVETLNDAIHDRRQIAFQYCTYDLDGNLVPRTDADGQPLAFTADPYALAYKKDIYYLLAHVIGEDRLEFFHVDHIRNLQAVSEPGTLERDVDSFSEQPGQPFNLLAYLDERPYPKSGPAADIHLIMRRTLEPLYSWFDSPSVERLPDGAYDIHLRASETSFLWWALQYADEQDMIEVLSPPSLRRKLCATGEWLSTAYAE